MNVMPPEPDERDHAAWLARARSTLDASTDALDAATLSALNRARQRALDAARRPQRPAWLWPLAFTAAASAAIAVMLVRPAAPPRTVPAAAALDARDLELVAGGELELYDDWEFYAWLDAQPADG